MNLNLTILGQSIAFFIFVWFCMKYVWPPIIGALAAREERIAGGLAAAEKAKQDLEQAEANVAQMLQEGREKAQEFVAQAERRGNDLVEEAKETARGEAERIVTAARAQVDQERNAVREEVGRFTSELIESLEQEAEKQKRPLAHASLAAEAMVTIAFNLGASALDRTASERAEVVERIVGEVRIIMRGAEAMGAGWEP